MKRVKQQTWEIVPPRRRWGCLVAGVVLTITLAAALGLLFFIVRPAEPVQSERLIGSDVDGLVFFELSGSSRRVARFVQVLIRPLSYEIQTHPEQLEEQINQLLSVITYRRAVGLTRFDPEAGREQWALVVGLKRMGDPIKLLVNEMLSREQTRLVETTTSGGVLLFHYENGGPYFAIYRRAFVAASDAAWLDEVVHRLRWPLKPTVRAGRLHNGLPPGGKHCLVRANILVSPGRWRHWSDTLDTTTSTTNVATAVGRILRQSGLQRRDVEAVRLSGTLQPRTRLQFDLSVACLKTSHSIETLRRIGARWEQLDSLMRVPSVAGITKPTTDSANLSFSWITLPVDELLGLSPAKRETYPPR